MTADTTALETHFKFGENWSAYSKGITQAEIDAASVAMRVLLPNLAGKTFLDIGCGSGLHALAALRLGTASVTAIDIDPQSVETARNVLSRFAGGAKWDTRVCSALEPAFKNLGQFDIAYSWGVLHHTGRMWDAIANAAQAVKPGGTLCIAIYAKTALCGFWRAEKRFYSKASAPVQWLVRKLFTAQNWTIQSAMELRRGKLFDFKAYKQSYAVRGMTFETDQHDWLGGYPYESATPEEITSFVTGLGFTPKLQKLVPGGRHGLFGSGCDEYVFERT